MIGLLVTLAFHSAAQSNSPTPSGLGENPSSNVYQIIQKPPCDPVLNKNQDKDDCHYAIPTPTAPKPGTSGHSIRAAKTITPEALRQYLESKKSPLSPYSERILSSPYWSTIIGICTIEQYSCSKAPNTSPYNFWGIMKPGGGLAQYASYEAGIDAINAFLTRADNTGHTTIEKLNGWYVVPASNSWFSTVLKTKTYLETL